jgi:hypothetical protein
MWIHDMVPYNHGTMGCHYIFFMIRFYWDFWQKLKTEFLQYYEKLHYWHYTCQWVYMINRNFENKILYVPLSLLIHYICTVFQYNLIWFEYFNLTD